MKKIEDFPDYYVTEDGRVWSSKSKQFLTPSHNIKGYLRVKLFGANGKKYGRHGTYKFCFIHRLVAKAFIPNPDNKPEVNHIDEYIFNNSASNLEWVTSSENKQHSIRRRADELKKDSPF